MTQVKPLVLLTVIFIIGIITGSALTIGLGSHWNQPAGEQQRKNQWMVHLTNRLNLTADQQTKIEPIVTDAEKQIQSVYHDEVGRTSQILDAANKQIAAILTPTQQEELKKMQAEREKYSGCMRPRDQHGPGDRPHGGQGEGPRGGPGGMPPHGGPGDNHPLPPPSGATNSAPAQKS